MAGSVIAPVVIPTLREWLVQPLDSSAFVPDLPAAGRHGSTTCIHAGVYPCRRACACLLQAGRNDGGGWIPAAAGRLGDLFQALREALNQSEAA